MKNYLASVMFLPALLAAAPAPGVKVELIGQFPLEQAWDLKVSGNYAYVLGGPRSTICHGCSSGATNLSVLDISDRSNPTKIASVPLSRKSHKLSLSGTLLVASSMDAIDVSNPANPVLVANYAPAIDFRLSGTNAFILNTSQLRILDVSEPAASRELGALSVAGDELRIGATADNRVYLLDSLWDSSGSVQTHVRIIDVVDPTKPTQTGIYIHHGRLNDILVSGKYAYLSFGGYCFSEEECPPSGLDVIDLSDPANPARVGTYPTALPAWNLSQVGQLIYLAVGEYLPTFGGVRVPGIRSLHVIDAGDPARLARVNAEIDFVNLDAMRIADGHLYFASNTAIQILQIDYLPRMLDFQRLPNNSSRFKVVAPETSPSFVLETASDLTNPLSWSLDPDVSIVPLNEAGLFEVTTISSGTAHFYRVRSN